MELLKFIVTTTHFSFYRIISELHFSPSVTPETGVIKILLDRCNNIVSEPEDREKEVEHIAKVLEKCGYPIWTTKKVKEQQSQKEKTKERKKRTERNPKVLSHSRMSKE